MSLEGGTPHNWGADRTLSPATPLTSPDSTRTQPRAPSSPPRAPVGPCVGHAKGAGHLTRGEMTGPFQLSVSVSVCDVWDYRRCTESATVTSTRWNSFSSL